MFIYITFFKKGLYFHQVAIMMHAHADKQTAMQHWVFHQRCLHISPGLWPVHTSVEPTRKYTNRGLERWLKASWYQPVQTHSNPASWPRLTDLSLTAQKQPEADQESALQPWPEIWEGDPSITASSFIHSFIQSSRLVTVFHWDGICEGRIRTRNRHLRSVFLQLSLTQT